MTSLSSFVERGMAAQAAVNEAVGSSGSPAGNGEASSFTPMGDTAWQKAMRVYERFEEVLRGEQLGSDITPDQYLQHYKLLGAARLCTDRIAKLEAERDQLQGRLDQVHHDLAAESSRAKEFARDAKAALERPQGHVSADPGGNGEGVLGALREAQPVLNSVGQEAMRRHDELAIAHGGVYPAERFGLSRERLDGLLDESDIIPPHGHGDDEEWDPTIHVPISLGDSDDRRWAVVRSSFTSERITWTLVGVLTDMGSGSASPFDKDCWSDRRKKHRKGAPEEVPLENVRCIDVMLGWWWFTAETITLFVTPGSDAGDDDDQAEESARPALSESKRPSLHKAAAASHHKKLKAKKKAAVDDEEELDLPDPPTEDGESLGLTREGVWGAYCANKLANVGGGNGAGKSKGMVEIRSILIDGNHYANVGGSFYGKKPGYLKSAEDHDLARLYPLGEWAAHPQFDKYKNWKSKPGDHYVGTRVRVKGQVGTWVFGPPEEVRCIFFPAMKKVDRPSPKTAVRSASSSLASGLGDQAAKPRQTWLQWCRSVEAKCGKFPDNLSGEKKSWWQKQWQSGLRPSQAVEAQ